MSKTILLAAAGRRSASDRDSALGFLGFALLVVFFLGLSTGALTPWLFSPAGREVRAVHGTAAGSSPWVVAPERHGFAEGAGRSERRPAPVSSKRGGR